MMTLKRYGIIPAYLALCPDAETSKLYSEVFERGQSLLQAALAALGFSDEEPNCKEDGAVVNTLPWPRAEMIGLGGAKHSTSNARYALLRSDGGAGKVEILSDESVSSSATITEVRKGLFILLNEEYEVRVENGNITSLVDREAGRELIPRGSKGHQFVIFDDKPLYWQGWDVEVYHLDTRKELKSGTTEAVERGPHRVSVVTKTQISDRSWVSTKISLAASIEGHSSCIEFESQVEWHEDMKFLKVEFPVDILNTEASYETQFGIIKRPTHYNTRYDLFLKYPISKTCLLSLFEAGTWPSSKSAATNGLIYQNTAMECRS